MFCMWSFLFNKVYQQINVGRYMLKTCICIQKGFFCSIFMCSFRILGMSAVYFFQLYFVLGIFLSNKKVYSVINGSNSKMEKLLWMSLNNCNSSCAVNSFSSLALILLLFNVLSAEYYCLDKRCLDKVSATHFRNLFKH